MIKLNLGCGGDVKRGWINIDEREHSPGILKHDLSLGIPCPDDSVDYIYAEHFIEHLDLVDGILFLQECRRVLTAEGVMRLSTPNLAEFCKLYQFAARGDDYLLRQWISYGWNPSSACVMMNEEFRLWGHKFIYDGEELSLSLHRAGFNRIYQCGWRDSGHAELCELESRPKHWNDLILEARTV